MRRAVSSGYIARFLILAAIIACLSACQPTPEEPIIVGKDQGAMLSAAVQTPEASGEGAPVFSFSDMTVPNKYTFNTTGADGKLTVAVDAPVIIPDADRLPTAKVVPGQFTQDMVSGMLDYLYDDTPYFQYDTRMTKDDYEQTILGYQEQMASEGTGEEADAALQQEIERFQEMMKDAPEKREEPKLSDGIMTLNNQTGEYMINVNSVDSKGYTVGSFNCSSPTAGIELMGPTTNGEQMAGSLFYSNYSSEDDEYYNYTMDNAQRVYSDEDIPSDLKEKLGVTLKEAEAQVKGLLDAAGIEDMSCSAAFIVDDHGTGHVDDYSGVASDFAFKMFYTRSVNGVHVIPTSEFAQNPGTDYDYLWIYENMQVIVTDGGIVDISWYGPCSVSEMVTDNTTVIDFEKAAGIFEKKILTFYEAQADLYGYTSIDIAIDSVELGLLRIKQQNAEGRAAGLYVPVWAFCGAVKYTGDDGAGGTYESYDSGCDFHDQPYIVLAVNAIDGSIIDVAKGY